MSTIKDIRLDNFLYLSGKYRFKKEFCDAIGMLPAYYSQITDGTKNIGHKVARQIEERLNLPNGYMDKPREDDDSPAVRDRETIAMATIINGFPPSVRENLKRFLYSIAAEMPHKEEVSEMP